MNLSTLTIATRESPLALWQAHWVKTQLETFYPTLTVQLLGLTTTADKMRNIPLMTVGGKGLFVKELEDALLAGRADMAVHSMKDVPMDLPEGLILGAFCERQDVRDVFVSNTYAHFDALPPKAIVGTSSLRRQCQIKALKKDIEVRALRGNINTRLGQLDEGEWDGIILAAAGLERLQLSHRIRSYFSIETSLPAAGQGVLGIECRAADQAVLECISVLNHSETAHCVLAERALCRQLGGGCQTPVAAFAELKDQHLLLRGLVGSPEGHIILRAEGEAPLNQPHELGERIANQLIAAGALVLLNDL